MFIQHLPITGKQSNFNLCKAAYYEQGSGPASASPNIHPFANRYRQCTRLIPSILYAHEMCIVGIMSRGRGQSRLAPRPTLLQTDSDNAQKLILNLYLD